MLTIRNEEPRDYEIVERMTEILSIIYIYPDAWNTILFT